MRFTSLKVWLPLLLAVVLAGCAGMKSAPQPLSYTPQMFKSGDKCIYVAKTDNAQFILDASLTRAELAER